MSKKVIYPAKISREGKYINLGFVDIPEAYTFAEDIDDLKKMAKEVLSLSINGRIQDDEDIPEPSKIEDIEKENDEEIILIETII